MTMYQNWTLCDGGKAVRMSLEVERLPCAAPGGLPRNAPLIAFKIRQFLGPSVSEVPIAAVVAFFFSPPFYFE